MAAIMELIRKVFDLLSSADERRDEAYLAEATDLYDLEFRMRKLDRDTARRQPSWSQYQG
jgi:hypothetical protein